MERDEPPTTGPGCRLHRTVLPLLVATLVLLVAACSSAADNGAGSGGAGSGAARLERIVSLSPTATETLWAIGAGSQVVAVDDQSNYPPGVPKTALSGFTPNVEAILGYQPDLVIATPDSPDLAAGLKAAGVRLLQTPAAATLDDAYRQIEEIGAVTGHAGQATALVHRMREQIGAAVAAAPRPEPPASYYHELDDTLFTATSHSFIGQIYSLFGMRNIADDGTGGPDYRQLSAEYVVNADPQVIFLADTACCGVTAQSLARRPGWASVDAVEHHRVYSLSADIASRWGPRIVDLVRAVSADLTAAHDGAPAPTR